MKDFACQTKDDLAEDVALVMVTDDAPDGRPIDDEFASVGCCRYCGHYPCGCGG